MDQHFMDRIIVDFKELIDNLIKVMDFNFLTNKDSKIVSSEDNDNLVLIFEVFN